ncbi:MAG: transcriptional regulator GcvA [Pseudomonadota bacterium]
MRRGQLPLNALRVFDAAARHLSFKLAADELAVTPAAVSQQIRALEDTLGVVLFKRQTRGLELTHEAQLALPALREGFLQFEEVVRLLQLTQRSDMLTVSVAPSFASKWLVPRIERFYNSVPDMDVRIDASNALVNFGQDNIDLAIRYGAGDYPQLLSERLIDEAVSPVCSPDLYASGGLETPQGLRDLILIHDDSSIEDESCPTWSMWLRAAGVGDIEGDRGLHFNQSNLAIEAAVAGKGVALAKHTIAADDIEHGRLVRPFADEQPVNFAYYLVAPMDRWRLPKVARFVEWLREEAAAMKPPAEQISNDHTDGKDPVNHLD